MQTRSRNALLVASLSIGFSCGGDFEDTDSPPEDIAVAAESQSLTASNLECGRVVDLGLLALDDDADFLFGFTLEIAHHEWQPAEDFRNGHEAHARDRFAQFAERTAQREIYFR